MSFQRASIDLHSLAPDRIPQDAPSDMWSTGNNILFRNGETIRAPGDTPTLPSDKVPLTMVYLTVASVGFWVYCTNDGVYAHDGTAEYDITPAAGWTGAETAIFSSCVLNGIPYVNASDRDPVYWPLDVLAPCVALPDWPLNGRCVTLRAHKNFLFAVGFLSEGDQRVRWSDAAPAGEVPAWWTPAADNLAGFVDIAPLSAPCYDGMTLRDSFFVFKQESIWSIDFVGGNSVFQFRKVFAEHGLAAPNAVTRGIDDVLLFVGNGSIYLTDGVKVIDVLDGKAQRMFYADYSANVNSVYSATTLERAKAGFIIYPKAGDVYGTRAFVYDFASGDIGFRDMPNVRCAGQGSNLLDVGTSNLWDGDPGEWQDDVTTWPQEVVAQSIDDVLIGGSFGFALISDGEANDFIDGPVSAIVERAGISFGDAQQRKMINRIWPKVIGRTGDTLTFRVGGQEITGGPVNLGPPVTFTIGQSDSIDTMVQGRFLSMEITSDGGAPWRMGSIDIEFRGVGGW